jgi:type IV pilus assembly protein PilE
MMKISKGFTLIQMVIVIAIIGILAAIAYPSYTQYTIRINRANAQSEMAQIAQKLQAYKVVFNSYAGQTIQGVYGSTVTPTTGTALYNLTLTISTDNQSWTLSAAPITGTVQAGNGVICLNDQGYKYWSKTAVVADCADSTKINATSTWIGQ